MMFTKQQNHLTLHFLEHMPVTNWYMTVGIFRLHPLEINLIGLPCLGAVLHWQAPLVFQILIMC